MNHAWKIFWILIELLAASATAAEELPTPVGARLHTIAVPRVIHAGRYIYAPSPVTGSAIFAATYLPAGEVRDTFPRKGDFKVDRNLPPELRAKSTDYEGSGLAKGHLIPWAHMGTEAAALSTLNFSNCAPQDANMNSGIWGQKIEPAVRALRDATHSVYDVTILIYAHRQQKPRWIGPGHILVPTHFAKAVLVLNGGEPERMVAWIVPNRPIADPDPDKFLVSVVDVQDQSQLDLFSDLDDELETRLENAR